MKRCIAISLVLISLANWQSFGQRKNIAPLLTQLEEATSDTSRFVSFMALGDIYLYDNPDSSRYYFTQAQYIADGNENPLYNAYILNRLGAVEWSLGNLDKALRLQIDALEIARSHNDMDLTAKCQLNIASLFSAVGDNLTSIDYVEQTIGHFVSTKNINRLIAAYNNIGKAYLSIMELDSAKAKLRMALDYADSAHEWMKPIVLFNLAECYYQNSEMDTAKYYLALQLKLSEKYKDRRSKCRGYQILAEIALIEGKIADAERYMDISLVLAEESRVKELIYICFATKAKVLAAMGQYKEAFDYSFRSRRYEDSVKSNIAKNQLAYYSYQKVNSELDRLKTESRISKLESEARKTTIFALIAILISISLALMGVFILLKKNDQKKKILVIKNDQIEKQHKELQSKSEELAELNTAKDQIISIITHDFRSPLISLNSLITMLNSDLIDEKEFRSLVPIVNDSLISTSMLLENLLAWSKRQLSGSELHPEEFEARKVINDVLVLSNKSIVEKSIKIQISNCDGCHCFADTYIIQIVLRNILSNAIKFSPEGGTIQFDCEPQGQYVILHVKDEGIGMTEQQVGQLFLTSVKPKIGTKGERGSGIGLMLCKELIEKTGGHFEIKSQPNVGTKLSVFVPRRTK